MQEGAPKNLTFEIILGSSSMARREILAEMGYGFSIMTADIEEKSIRKEEPEDLVMALAEAKADAIMMRLKSRDKVEEILQPTLLITADTCIKGSLERSHQVRKKHASLLEVYFLDIPDEVVDSLIEEGIIFNVAGGLMLEHPLTLPLVDAVVGTPDCVMGLPKTLTERLILEAL